MKILSLLLLLSLVFCESATSLAQQDIIGTLMHNGQQRNYRLHLPPNFGDLRPLVLNMHGFTSNAEQQEGYSGMNAVADREGFAVCYPNGIQNQWNVGWAFNQPTDDVGFLTRLVDTLLANYHFSSGEIYACGMSNGGFMSYRLACETTGVFAAIGSVTGGMVPGLRNRCDTQQYPPVIEIHGTADAVVAYNGSVINDPTEVTVDFSVSQLHVDPDTAIVQQVPDRADDGYTTTKFIYLSADLAPLGDSTTVVELWRVNGGQHTWPGAGQNLATVTYDFNASEELWRFFSQHFISRITNTHASSLGQNQLHVYPNPAAPGQVFVDVSAEQRDLQVLDLQGRVVSSTTLAPGETELSTRDLPAGVYVLTDRACRNCTPIRLVVQ